MKPQIAISALTTRAPHAAAVQRMVDQEIVREQFYLHTPADGTPEQKGNLRRQQFFRALDWAERNRLVAIEEIDGVVYLWLNRPETDQAEEE